MHCDHTVTNLQKQNDREEKTFGKGDRKVAGKDSEIWGRYLWHRFSQQDTS